MRLVYCKLDNQSGHIAGRSLLRRLYLEETGCDLPEILIGEHGRPYFANSPYFFSISHTPKHAFCVLARNNIAVDAEELDRKVSDNLARRILQPLEYQQYEIASNKQRAFLTFWVLKEATAKLNAAGVWNYSNLGCFSMYDERVCEIDGCLVAVVSEES